MHLVIEPVTRVLLLITPYVSSVTLDLIHLELSFIHRSVCECQLALPILLAFEVHALVHCAIRPRLQTIAMLFIITPCAHILGTVRMSVSTVTVSFIIDPVSIVNVTICVIQLASTIGFAVPPLADVLAAVKPLLLALAIADAIEPLTLVDGSTLQVDRRFHLSDISGEI